jgi:hypothetical protein
LEISTHLKRITPRNGFKNTDAQNNRCHEDKINEHNIIDIEITEPVIVSYDQEQDYPDNDQNEFVHFEHEFPLMLSLKMKNSNDEITNDRRCDS